jgi:hypothetical protein
MQISYLRWYSLKFRFSLKPITFVRMPAEKCLWSILKNTEIPQLKNRKGLWGRYLDMLKKTTGANPHAAIRKVEKK